MPQTGILRTWNEERGFGFIAPTGGGRELFVHISAFPRDGSRPTVGESLSYEPGQGADGRPQAVRVIRQAIGKPSTHPRAQVSVRRRRRSLVLPLVALVLMIAIVIAVGVFGYNRYRPFAQSQSGRPLRPAIPEAVSAAPAPGSFRCDGRTHCSQMTSCREAKFFLKNCPGTKMDGNNDGVPCEQQWCTSPFAD
ncbi:cold shock domain-containing protein [Rhizobacter sp. OV335]|jgi:cold shock CspA family protein|uniref:cold shock domain-containing protein n=1 Tax=Rhizobacter sp. OV335 TaxID=1500264 RepID=UPI0009368A39|nr:cold shock domain-containing protein [Rhizobacter sp. OV335]